MGRGGPRILKTSAIQDLMCMNEMTLTAEVEANNN